MCSPFVVVVAESVTAAARMRRDTYMLLCLLARQARQKRMGEIRCSRAACALHDEARDLHRFGSYVTGHLPRTHPLVENETLDDRAPEGVWLGNDLSTPMF